MSRKSFHIGRSFSEEGRGPWLELGRGSVESPEAHGSHADAGDEDDTGPLIAGTPGSPAAGTDAAMLAADDALIQKYVCPL